MPERVVKVGFSVAWSGDQSPGWRACTVTAYAADGSVVAQKTLDLFDESAAPSDQYILLKPTDMRLGQRPNSAKVECAAARLDDPSGYYEFENVRVHRAPEYEGDPGFRLEFDDRWVGAGRPGVQECVASMRDRAGVPLFDYTFTFSDSMGASRALSFPFAVPSGSVGEPASATISCNPI